MSNLHGGAAVILSNGISETEGIRAFRVPIARAMGARDITQSVSLYAEGRAPARRRAAGEEALYVVSGEGDCYVDGYCYKLAPGTGIYVPPASVCQIESRGGLLVVSVCCPDDTSEVGVEPILREPMDTKPLRAVREQDQESIPTGDRTFKLLVSQATGASRITQFIGVIPPGRAPLHHHTYEEAIYIVEGFGRVHTETGSQEFGAGASIYLPRGVSHSLENTGTTNIRLLGVFHPSGSPAARYDD
ncbi:MAG: cupin domain-containing protein [Blastocatellia bacterium]